MAPSSTVLFFVLLVIIGLVAYYTWLGLVQLNSGSLKTWVDNDFPDVVHTPKPTWLTGFRYKQHGIDTVAKLDVPVFLDYDKEAKLGRFSIVDTFARATSVLDGTDKYHEKDLVSYDCGLDLELLTGGQVALTMVYNRMSVTEVEPIIEANACE